MSLHSYDSDRDVDVRLAPLSVVVRTGDTGYTFTSHGCPTFDGADDRQRRERYIVAALLRSALEDIERQGLM